LVHQGVIPNLSQLSLTDSAQVLTGSFPAGVGGLIEEVFMANILSLIFKLFLSEVLLLEVGLDVDLLEVCVIVTGFRGIVEHLMDVIDINIDVRGIGSPVVTAGVNKN